MNVQVFGFNDDFDTKKALRFFSERRIPVHFVNLAERPASRGELRRFQEKFGAAALVDRESSRFRALGLRVSGDSPERLLERALTEPRLLRVPLVRAQNRLSIGEASAEWRAWVDAERTKASDSANPERAKRGDSAGPRGTTAEHGGPERLGGVGGHFGAPHAD